jgi:hypothetical protein
MALIEKFPIVADHYPVASGQSIIEGMVVKLNSSGEVVIATGASGEVALGLAGDTKSTSTSGLPTTNSAFVGTGTSTSFVNRVSDNFDETKASGRMTVYHSGGTFATNQFVSGSYAVNDDVFVASGANSGLLTGTTSTSAQVIAYVVKAPAAFDSGVPGTDVSGSLSLGSYMEIKLVI